MSDNVKDMYAKGRRPIDYIAGIAKIAVEQPGSMVGSKNGHAKLTDNAVREIRILYKSGISQTELAIKFGVTQVSISQCVLRKTWSHLP